MKKLIAVVIAFIGINLSANAQDVKTVSLEQTAGEFTQKSITLAAGSYVFEIANTEVDKKIGFVLAPKGKTDKANHIQNAYVTKLVEKNQKQKSKVVTLAKGEYVYFCPFNATPQYTLVVE